MTSIVAYLKSVWNFASMRTYIRQKTTNVITYQYLNIDLIPVGIRDPVRIYIVHAGMIDNNFAIIIFCFM